MTNTNTATAATKKLVVSADILSAICDFQWKVEKYMFLTNDDYETDFSYAADEIEESKKALDKLLRRAEKV